MATDRDDLTRKLATLAVPESAPADFGLNSLVLKYQEHQELYDVDLKRAVKSTDLYVYKAGGTIADILATVPQIQEKVAELNPKKSNVVLVKDGSGTVYAVYKSRVKAEGYKYIQLNTSEDLGGLCDEYPDDVLTHVSSAEGKKLLSDEVIKDSNFSTSIFQIFEQLSPVGIALLSHIKAQGDSSQKSQPYVATSIEEISDAAAALQGDAVKVGDRIPVVFQNIGNTHHKTVVMLEKTSDGVSCFHIDSNIPTSGYSTWKIKLLKESLDRRGISSSHYLGLPPHGFSEDYMKQYDWFQCGTYAIKDARNASTSTDLSGYKVELPATYADKFPAGTKGFRIPPRFFKGVQSQAARKAYRSDMSYSIPVTKVRKDGTIETIDKAFEDYLPLDYTRKFSEKYLDQVAEYFSTHGVRSFSDAQAYLSRRADPATIRANNEADKEIKGRSDLAAALRAYNPEAPAISAEARAVYEALQRKAVELVATIRTGTTSGIDSYKKEDIPALYTPIQPSGAEPSKTPLQVAIDLNNSAMLVKLAEFARNPNLRSHTRPFSPISCILAQSSSADARSHIASYRDKGGKLSAKDIDGNTALHIAVSENKPELVQELLTAGEKYSPVNSHLLNADGKSAMDIAIENGAWDIVTLMHSHKCGFNGGGSTPAHELIYQATPHEGMAPSAYKVSNAIRYLKWAKDNSVNLNTVVDNNGWSVEGALESWDERRILRRARFDLPLPPMPPMPPLLPAGTGDGGSELAIFRVARTTPLDLSLLETLLREDLDTYKLNEDGKSILEVAIENDNWDFVTHIVGLQSKFHHAKATPAHDLIYRSTVGGDDAATVENARKMLSWASENSVKLNEIIDGNGWSIVDAIATWDKDTKRLSSPLPRPSV